LQDRPYVMGDKFGVADAYLFTVLSWAGVVGFDLGKWPLLQQYCARIAQRPKVVEALQAEGLLKAA
jgi:glutathione S-transferase